ncbi:hypothetical protein BJX64DRAFT_281303 [Aspergillus heterothallicus]
MSPTASSQAFSRNLPSNIPIKFNGNYRKIQSSAGSNRNTDAVRVYIEEEGSHILETEADVLRISTLQLLHPIDFALKQLCPKGTLLTCSSEVKAGSSCRFDLQWALYTPHRYFAQTANYKAKMDAAMKVPETHSLLRDNAYWLSKQAAKYREFSPYVAIFDWNAMFLFSFHSGTEQPPQGLYFDDRGNTDGMTFCRLLFAFVSRPLREHLGT